MAQRDSTLKSQSVATRMYQILSTLDIEFKLTSCVMNFSWLVRNGVSLVYMISCIHFVGIFFPTLASRLNNPPRILIVRLVNVAMIKLIVVTKYTIGSMTKFPTCSIQQVLWPRLTCFFPIVLYSVLLVTMIIEWRICTCDYHTNLTIYHFCSSNNLTW